MGTMSHEHLDGLLVSDIADNFTYRRLIVRLAEEARLPTIYPYRTYFDEGGLMVYGSDLAVSTVGLRATLTRFSEVQKRAKFRFIWSLSSSW